MVLALSFLITRVVLAQKNDEVQNNLNDNFKVEEKYLKNQSDIYMFLVNREDKISNKMLEYSQKSLDYSRDAINYFLVVLGVIGSFCLIFGIKNFLDIKKRSSSIVKNVAKKEVKKVVGELKKSINKLNITTEEIKKKTNKIEKASDLWEQFHKNNPEGINRKENLENKLNILNKIIEIDSGNYKAYGYKGLILKEMGKNKDAIEYFNKALLINQKDFVAHYNKVLCLIDLKENKNALICINKLIKKFPEKTSLFLIKSICLEELGLLSESLRIINKAINIDNENSLFLNKKARVLLEMKNYKEAIKFYDLTRKMAVKNNEKEIDNSDYYVNVSFAYHKLKDFLNAYKVSKNGFRFVFSIELFVNRGLAAAALKKEEEAINLFDEATSMISEDNSIIAEFLYCKSRMFSLIEKKDKSLKFLKDSIKKDVKFIEMAKTEEDFNSIADSEEFKAIIYNGG